MATLTKLKELILSRNQIQAIPDKVLGAMVKLEILKLDRNVLKALPPSIETLSKLKQIDLSGNQLGWFPVKLPASLTVILCRDCGIASLPEDGWASFPQLLELDVSGNKIESLPDGLSECKKLKILRAANNRLSVVPASVLQGTVVSAVSFKGNQFDEKQFEQMEGFGEYMKRRKARLDKSLSADVNLDGFNEIM